MKRLIEKPLVMRTLLNLAFIFLLGILIHAQPIPENMNVNSTMNVLSKSGSDFREAINSTSMFGRTMPKQETDGSTFYTEEWIKGNLHLTNGKSINDEWIVYDIDKNLFYLRLAEEDIRVLKGTLVESFDWYNSENSSNEFFVSKNAYATNPDVVVNFLKVIYEDKVSLLMGRNNKVKKADYKEGIATGRPYDTILKEDRFYLAVSGSIYEFTGKVKNDQETLNAMGIADLDLKSFEKSNKVKIKTEVGLLALAQELSGSIQ